MNAWLELARQNAPFLMLAAPLCGAALSAIAPSGRLAWAIAVLALLASTAIGLDLAYRVLLLGAAPNFATIGVALELDGVGAFAAPVIAAAGALTMIAAGALQRADLNTRAAPFGLALAQCVAAGWMAAAFASDLIVLFVGAETAWLASVGLIALGAERDRGALTGAFRMLTAGGVAGAVLLLGIGLISRSVGVIEIGALSSSPIAAPDLCAVGVGLVLTALTLKAGLAPLHMWIGAAYGRGSAFAALVLGAVGVVGALAAITRVAAAGLATPPIGQGVSAALVGLGIASVAIGSVQAVGARNLRRLAAYAGAAQAGCVLVSAALGSPAGYAATLVQILAQAAAAIALLGGVAALGGATQLSALDGLARRAPLASATITAGALSLMGAPLTLGFLGRWRMIEAGVGAGWWWAAGSVIGASLAAVIYGGRLIERLYFRRAAETFQGNDDAWRFTLAPALMVSIAVIAIGFEPSTLLRAADAAAHLLAGEP